MYWLPYSSHTSHHPSQTPCIPWISYATQKLILDSCKMVLKQFETFHTFLWHFSKLKHNFIACRSSKVSSRPDCILEIHQLWQSDFNKLYSNYCSSCSLEAEIIKIVQSSYKMCNNKIVNFQASTTILNACTEKVWKLIAPPILHLLELEFLQFHTNDISFIYVGFYTSAGHTVSIC